MFYRPIKIICLVFTTSVWCQYVPPQFQHVPQYVPPPIPQYTQIRPNKSDKFSKVIYQFSQEPVDVVIPCVAKDLETLEISIEGIRKNGKNLGRIIIISKEKLTDSVEWFDEANFPFTKEEMALEIFRGDEEKTQEYLNTPGMRIGWLYQQMLKLYATLVIPDISSNVLVMDADVIFLNPVEFTSPTGGPYFSVGREYMKEYFDHIDRLLPGIRRVHSQYSGIAHHMLLQRPIIEDLFDLISKQHKTDAWRAFCRCIDPQEIFKSPFSEYETYFNFTLLRTDQGAIRHLRWTDVFNLRTMEHLRRSGYSYIACHEWWRTLNGEPLWGR